MQHDRRIGGVDRHVQRLPQRRPEEGKPEIVAGERQGQQHQEAEKSEPDEAGIGGQQRGQNRRRAEGKIPVQHGKGVPRRHRAGHHAEMAAIVEQRQEPRIQPGRRANGQRQGQQQLP